MSERQIDFLVEMGGQQFVRAEHLEDMLETLVRACDEAGVTQVPAGTSRPDLEHLRAVIDSAKCLLP